MILLRPAELLYQGVNRLRRGLYRRGVLRSRRLPRPVVSVGNLAVGGTGKTPLTLAIARRLVADGLRVAILTRGYGRASNEQGLVVEGRDVARYGDEPVLLAASLPGTDVVVGSDRFASATSYLQRHDCDLFLLDDGFQHLQLARDADVVLLGPAAYHREGRSALADATLVVAREGVEAPPGSFRAELRPVAVVIGAERLPVDALAGRELFAFAGLAANAQFFQTLERLGGRLAGKREFADHHAYTQAEIDALVTEAGKALPVTTGKDWVKIERPEVAWLDVELELPSSFFDRLRTILASRRDTGR